MFDHRPFAINALRLSNKNEVTVSFVDQSFTLDQMGRESKTKRFSSEQSPVPVSHFVGRAQITELDPQKGFVSQYNFAESQYAQLSMGRFQGGEADNCGRICLWNEGQARIFE